RQPRQIVGGGGEALESQLRLDFLGLLDLWIKDRPGVESLWTAAHQWPGFKSGLTLTFGIDLEKQRLLSFRNQSSHSLSPLHLPSRSKVLRDVNLRRMLGSVVVRAVRWHSLAFLRQKRSDAVSLNDPFSEFVCVICPSV